MRVLKNWIAGLGLSLLLAAGCDSGDSGGEDNGGLTAPSGLKATTVEGKPHLTWKDGDNEDMYMVERMSDGSDWATVTGADNLVPNTVQYHDTTAVAGTTYSYRVVAMKGDQEAMSNEVTWP